MGVSRDCIDVQSFHLLSCACSSSGDPEVSGVTSALREKTDPDPVREP